MSERQPINDRLSNALGIEGPATPSSEPKAPLALPDPNESDLDEDWSEVRSNMKQIISAGQQALEGILAIAEEGDQPRAYEVVAELITTMSNANKDMIALHKQIRAIKSGKESQDSLPQLTGNTTNVFIGSTRDLQDLLRKQREEIAAAEREIIDAEVVSSDTLPPPDETK